MSSTPKLQYEQRLVMFLDFLGFREIIDKSVRDASWIDRIGDAIDQIKELVDDSEIQVNQQVTQFSDSVVVSFLVSDRSAVFDLICEAAFCLVELVGRGFLMRGAITTGALHHTRKHLFGPALVQAYKLESEQAKYPRVLVDESVFEIAKAYHAEHHDSEQELKSVRSFVSRDEDGRWHLPYVSWKAVVATIGAENERYAEYLDSIHDLLRVGLKMDDRKVLEKYIWLHRQYQSAIQDFVNAAPEFKIAYPEMCDSIFSLPRLDVEVLLAREKVAEIAPRN